MDGKEEDKIDNESADTKAESESVDKEIANEDTEQAETPDKPEGEESPLGKEDVAPGNTNNPETPDSSPSGDIDTTATNESPETEEQVEEKDTVIDKPLSPTKDEDKPVTTTTTTTTTPTPATKENEEESTEEPLPTYDYDYESLYSKPAVIHMEDNKLQLLHSFGYECQKRSNLITLDQNNLMYAAGNLLVILNITTRDHTLLRTLGGGGVGAITVHPSHEYFAVGEKGVDPVIAIYSYPSLKLFRILRGGTEQQYSHMDFSPQDGNLLASVGGYPDYMLTVWNWESESIVLRSKAFSQEIYRVSFSPELPGQLTTSGTGHIRFWKMASTFTGLKLQGYLGKFGQTELSDIGAYIELPDGKVLSGSEWGNMLLWDGGFIKVELSKKGKKFCHNGVIEVLYLDEGEVISAGADGFIRIWNFESIDNADATEDKAPIEIEPLTEIKVGSDVSIKSLSRSSDPDTPTVWYGQDAKGAIWKLDIVASHTRKPSEKLINYHSGEIYGVDCSPNTNMAGSIGEDGSVRVCSLESSEVLCHVKYPSGGSSLIWCPLILDASGMTLVAGFTDGVVRILKLDKDSYKSRSSAIHIKGVPTGKLSLVNVSKPHTQAVTAIAIDPEGKLLATGSEDSTVFFINLTNEFAPIGFVKVPGPVSCMTWSQTNQGPLKLLVCCSDGSMAEIMAPKDDYDISQSYYLEDVTVLSRKFVSIKDRLRREEVEAAKAAEKERKLKIKEAAKKARREKRKAELGDDYQSEEEEEEEQEEEQEEEEGQEEIEKGDGPSPIHAVFYENGVPNNFWISVGGYDAGYLYRGSLEGSGNINEPYETPHTVPVPELNSTDVPIHSMIFSKTGNYLLTGTGNGCVRVYHLHSAYSLVSLNRHWTLSIHDNHYGHVNRMCLSYDGSYLVTGGADGNMFVYKTDLPASSKYARSDTMVKGTQILCEPSDPIRDIDDSSHYSIEDAKRKAEQDRMIKVAEAKKQHVRKEITKLRRQFNQLQQKSARLPTHLRPGQQDFVMDPSMSHQLQQQLQEKVELVRREMAWESEKHQIALDKLKQRYKDCVECEHIVVYCIKNKHDVASFRTAFPSDKFLELMHKLVSEDVAMTPWTAEGEKKGVSRRNTQHTIEKDDTEGLLGEDTEEGKELSKKEARRLKKEKRKREWEELNRAKPGENFEDPREVEAIERAKREMGDYKLKTSSDFVVSEDQRTSTAKKRKEMVLCRNTIFETKRSFNNKLLSLRENKLAMIDKIKEFVKQLKGVQSQLSPSLRKPISSVPKMYPEEIPERELEYTKDSLIKFKENLQRREAAEKQAQSGGEGFGGFGGFGGDEQQEEGGEQEQEEKENEESSTGSTSSISSSTARPINGEEEMSDLERLMATEKEMLLIYQQDSILKEIEKSIEEFDKRVMHLRHERSLEEIKIKSAEMKHLTQFEEMELLKEFEKRESIFTGKYRAKKQEKSDLEIKIDEIDWSIKEKDGLYQTLIEQQKSVDQNFTESVGENNKFKDFLTKVYRKKIKRAKLKSQRDTGEEGGDGDDDDTDSDSDSDWSSEDESDEEGFDDTVCPPGCDQSLFDLAIEMREKRMDVEDILAEEKKSLDNLKREFDGLMKKAKTIDAHVKTALQELQAFQLKKQQRINELDAIVVLKLHQILHYQSGGLPPTNVAQCLVFPASAREHLANRIGELVQEKQQEKKRYRELRQHHVRLVRERKIMEKKVAELNEKANEMMRLKFGRIVNLDALEGLTTNKMIGELEQNLQEEVNSYDNAMATVEKKINTAQQNLLSIVKQNTDSTNRLHELTTKSRHLEQGLNARQKQSGDASLYNAFEPDEKARLLQIVQIQNQEIQALREEIQVLSHKGGKLLPPPQAPGTMTNVV